MSQATFKNRAYNAFMSQPPIIRGLEIAFGVVVTYFAARGVWKFIKSRLDTAKERKTINNFKDDIKQLDTQGIKPSFTDSQYKGWADTIQNQFDGIDWSPSIFKVDIPVIGGYSGSGKTLYSILWEFKNDADFAKLVEAYGIRTYDQAGPFTGNFTGDLHAAVNDELDQDEIDGLNAMLESKNIKYRF